MAPRQGGSMGGYSMNEREAFDAMSKFLWQYANRADDEHLGSMDPTTGEMYKPAVAGRTIDIP